MVNDFHQKEDRYFCSHGHFDHGSFGYVQYLYYELLAGSFNTILNDNSRCHDFQEALDLEIESFADYIRDATPDTRDQYVLSCVRTERCLRSLPFDYARIGTERYARTWSILNGYETYQAYRDELAETQVRESDFVERLYRVYKMQEYLQTYARRLVQVTLKEGNDSYQEKVPVFYNMPYLILAISAVFMGFVMFLTKILSTRWYLRQSFWPSAPEKSPKMILPEKILCRKPG